jgi:hypothetical protein
MKEISKTREIMFTLLKLNRAKGILSILRYGDQLSFTSLLELEEDCLCHIFIPQESDWLLVLTERKVRDIPIRKLKKVFDILFRVADTSVLNIARSMCSTPGCHWAKFQYSD